MKIGYFVNIVYIILVRIFFVEGVTKCESRVELRAVLLSCPTKDSGCEDDDPLTQAMNAEESQMLRGNAKNFESMKEERERGFPNAVKDCKRKLIITLKMKNAGKIPCDDEYIVVDHVFDPVTGGKGRLLSPVVLKLRQEQMIQLYGLQFQKVVNSDPFEEQKPAEETCSVDPANPTCGIAVYNGKPIPFSEGFCCSGDPLVNEKRQAASEDPLERFSETEGRFIREGRPPVEILNPELLEIKAEADYDTSSEVNDKPPQEEEEQEEENTLIKELSMGKIPNFLMEKDRKIVCDRGDFLIELCRLQDEKNKGKIETSYNSNIFSKIAFGDTIGSGSNHGKPNPVLENGNSEVFGDKDPATVTEKDLSNLISKGQSSYMKGAEGIRSFFGLRGGSSRSQVLWKDDFNEAKLEGSSRDKRENEPESFESDDELNLNERLERFFKLKHNMGKRRKRLLELSHRRYRQSDAKCQGGGGCPTVSPPPFPRQNSGRTEPPEYFFCHDKFILHPQASQQFSTNSSVVMSQQVERVNGLHKVHEKPPDENPSMDNSGKLRQNENKFKTNEKLKKDMVAKARNKEKATHDAGVSIQNNIFKEAKHKEYIDKKSWTNSKESIEKKEHEQNSNENSGNGFVVQDTKSRADNRENSGVLDRQQNQKGYSDTTDGKGVQLQKENEDKVTRSKIRNFLISQSRDKQAPKSELVRPQKKPEVYSTKDLEKDALKLQELLGEREGKSKEKETEAETRVDDRDKAVKPSDEPRENHERAKVLGKSEQSFDRKHSRPDMSSLGDVEKTFLKSRSKAPSPASMFGGAANVDFSVEIVRKQYPDVSDFHLPSLHAEQSLARRINTPRHHVETKVYDLNEFNHRIPLRSRLSQKYKGTPDNSRFGYSRDNNHLDDRRGYHRQRPHSVQLSREYSDRNRHRWKGYNYRTLEKHQRNPPFDQVPRQNFLTNRHEKYPNEYRYRGRNPHQETENLREVDGDKIRIKRTSAYSFEPAKGFFSSEFPNLKDGSFQRLRNPRIVHRLEACQRPVAEAEDLDDVPLWRFPRRDALSFGTFTEPDTGLPFGTFNASLIHVSEEESAKMTRDKERLAKSYINAPVEREPALKGKRQVKETKKAPSKGSSERDRYAGEYTQDTAHCMRFGDLWYSVYSIKKPVVAQIVGVQLFDKKTLCDGTAQWRDLTKGKMVRIGTFLPKAEDDLPTISITYMGGKTKKIDSAIDPDNYFLLIPSHVSDPSKSSYYPQFDGGPAEYLLIESKDLSSGGDCNMIGTSFEAFVRRVDRCSENRGSCLKRQPVDLWREDMEARIRGKRGKYFVENFGTVPNSPVKTFTNLTGEFLALEYYGEYASVIEIEVKADSNTIIRKGSTAQIPSVYIDSTYPKKTRIILSVLNIGLTSSYFRPRLGDCPPNLDTAWCPLEGPLVTIPPQQRHDFKLDLSGVLPSNKIRVTVQVLNQFNKKVAYRKITIKNGDRCVCAFHCECNCVGNLMDGRTCHKLSLQEYRGAGYLGSFPFRGGAATSASESIRSNIHIVFVTAAYVLLLFGLVKALFGVYFRRLGIAGTRVIVGPRKLCRYYECELQFCSVLFDECGFPIHPTTYTPVQIVPLWAEIVINIFFFFLYPLRGIWFLISSSTCCRAACPGCDGCCRQDEDFEYDKCSRPLLSKNVQPTCVNYNLTTLNATKQETDEYLPYLPYKGDDDPLEEDDTDFVLREMKRYRNK